MAGTAPQAPGLTQQEPRRRPPVLLGALFGLGLLLLGTAWTLSLPFDGSADEQAHLIKALAVGGGDPAGTGFPPLPARAPAQVRFIRSTSRLFHVPVELNPRANTGCFILKPHRPASCLRPVTGTGSRTAVSYVGVYPPLAYVAPGLATRLFNSPAPALIAARLANGVTCGVLWVIAAAAFVAIRARRGWLLTGLLLSVTPAAVALAWSVNPNGPEAAAGAAFVALTLAATRPSAPRWTWWLMAPVGFFLASSRPASPAWVAFGFAVPVLLRGRPALAAARHGGRAATAGIGAGALGAVLTGVWNLAIGASPASGHRDWVALAGATLREFQGLQAGTISQVDWGETGLSNHLYRPWELMVALLLVAGVLAGSRRHRVGLLGVAGAYLLACFGIVALMSATGYPPGGRFLMAPAVALPLAAAEVCQERIARLGTVALVAGVAVAGATQLAVLYESARRYAVGSNGRRDFLWSGTSWQALGGWPLAAALGLAGAVLLAALVLADHRAPARRAA